MSTSAGRHAGAALVAWAGTFALFAASVIRNNSIRGVLTDLGMAVASSQRDRRCPYSFRALGGPTAFECISAQTEPLAGGRENLFLRRRALQRAGYQASTHRCCDSNESGLPLQGCYCRDALVVVRPETLIRWHRAGWRLLWRWKVSARAPADSVGAAPVDSAHGNRESTVGRRAYCQ